MTEHTGVKGCLALGMFSVLFASPAWPDWLQMGECLNNTITSAALHLDITTYNNTP